MLFGGGDLDLGRRDGRAASALAGQLAIGKPGSPKSRTDEQDVGHVGTLWLNIGLLIEGSYCFGDSEPGVC